jgi:hypothetical protein
LRFKKKGALLCPFGHVIENELVPQWKPWWAPSLPRNGFPPAHGISLWSIMFYCCPIC